MPQCNKNQRSKPNAQDMGLTFQAAIEVWAGGYLEAWVRQEETVDLGEAGVDVLPDVLDLFMLVGGHLAGEGKMVSHHVLF